MVKVTKFATYFNILLTVEYIFLDVFITGLIYISYFELSYIFELQKNLPVLAAGSLTNIPCIY